MIGGLLAFAMTQMFNASWQLKLSTILVPAAIYLAMALSMEYPQTERVQSNVSTGEMWAQMAKPLFLLLFICMWMTAAAELGPDQWFPSVMSALVPRMQGVLFLVYTAGLMFVLRTFGSVPTRGNWTRRSPAPADRIVLTPPRELKFTPAGAGAYGPASSGLLSKV